MEIVINNKKAVIIAVLILG